MKALLQRIALLLPLAALAAAPLEKLGFDPQKEPEKAAAAYFAPESLILFRMRYPDGTYREFMRNFDKPNRLKSVGGWVANIKGDRITVKTGPNVEGGPASFVFQKGRLVEFAQGDVKKTFPYEGAERPLAGDAPPYHFGDARNAQKGKKAGKVSREKRQDHAIDRKSFKSIAGKWKKSGRLQWPFISPNENGCLYASLALLACYLFYMKRRSLQLLGGALFLAFAFALVMTASRGAFLALAIALLPTFVLRGKAIVRSKAMWILFALVVLAAAGWFLTHDARLLTRGFRSASSWSNEVRLEMWRTVPQMIAEAPGGWKFAHVGRAFLDWYQSLELVSLPGSLMNDHLTRIVGYGWLGRFCYLFAWLACFGVLAVEAVRTRKAIALGAWMLFAVAGWFNPLYALWWLWIPPIAATAICLFDRPWRGFRLKWAGLAVGGAALLTGLALCGVWLVGRRAPARGYPVRAIDKRVYVKGMKPRIWIVDDGYALGGVLSCKEIRGYYVYRPDAPSVGYVRVVDYLPKEKIHRLVLGGQAGADWMDWLREQVEAAAKENKAPQINIPDEVVFVSPPFPPSALPEGLLQSCKVRLLVGEFAARYEPEYANPPPWVRIVPAMELYFVDWMKQITDG